MRVASVFAAAALAAGCLVGPAAQAGANIVQNPSFEQGWAGWSSANFGLVDNNAAYANSGVSAVYTGCDGHSCVEFNPESYIEQALATTPGQTYTLSFWVAENYGPTSEFSVFWNGAMVADVLNPNNKDDPAADCCAPDAYKPFTFTGLVASGAVTDLQVHGRDDPNGIFFDDFSVTAAAGGVPEPATWAMLILGLAIIGFAARRRTAGVALAA